MNRGSSIQIDVLQEDRGILEVDRQPGTLLPDPEREELWCPIISVDDHVLEPPSLFEGRVPRRYLDRAPRVVEADDGAPRWEIDGRRYPITVSNGAVGRPRSEWTLAPARYEEFRDGVWDSTARLKDMDQGGIWASVCFPSIPWGFAGTRISFFSDESVGFALLRAYNDWMLNEWCAADRERYVPCQLPWLRDPHIAAEEIRSNAAKGFRCVSFSENPERLGLPSLHTSYWDPFFDACQETETVINLHVGSSGEVVRPSSDSPGEVVTTLFPLNGIMAVVDWIYAKVAVKFPNIKIVLSEAGCSWVPMVRERLGRAHRRLDASGTWSASDPNPVDLLTRCFWFTSIEDPAAFQYLDLIGASRVLVEVDYPHFDTTWPEAQAMIRTELAHMEPKDVHAVCHSNAAELYRWVEPPEAWLNSAVVAPSRGPYR